MMMCTKGDIILTVKHEIMGPETSNFFVITEFIDSLLFSSYFLEVRLMLVLWALIIITWLWGGLHMAYSQLWMLVFFCIFNIITVK